MSLNATVAVVASGPAGKVTFSVLPVPIVTSFESVPTMTVAVTGAFGPGFSSETVSEVQSDLIATLTAAQSSGFAQWNVATTVVPTLTVTSLAADAGTLTLVDPPAATGPVVVFKPVPVTVNVAVWVAFAA